ncbi:hypothetical protein PQX77_020233 [Marasmius sp. AFHP31]|nr:hypothetical protein PQX77_020233 [Marasmius sp. AFHP31]
MIDTSDPLVQIKSGASRISIIYSIIRIDPNSSRRKIYVGVSYVYFIVLLVLTAQLFWVCEPEPGWKDTTSPQCHLTPQVAIFQLVTDILADSFLLYAPVRVFVHIRDKALRRKLVIIFSTCLITTIVSLVHAAYILTTGGIPVIISALVEDSVSLMVANLVVVVTALLRAGVGDKDEIPAPAKTSTVSSAVKYTARKLGISKAGGSGEFLAEHAEASVGKSTDNVTSEPIVLESLDKNRAVTHNQTGVEGYGDAGKQDPNFRDRTGRIV